MKTKKQTETNENQSIITNSFSGNKAAAPYPVRPARPPPYLDFEK